jgi:hypothetical protein
MISSKPRSLIANVLILASVALWVESAHTQPRATASVTASNFPFGGFQSVGDVQHTDDFAHAFASVVGGFGQSSAQLGGTISALAVASGAVIGANGLIIDTVTLFDPDPFDDLGHLLTLTTTGTTSGNGGLSTASANRGTGPSSGSFIVHEELGSFLGPNVFYRIVYKLPPGTYDLVIGLSVGVSGTGVANFEDTLVASIDSPPGGTFTSSSGMFLTQQEEPPGTPSLPEPAALFLIALGLAGIWMTRPRARST